MNNYDLVRISRFAIFTAVLFLQPNLANASCNNAKWNQAPSREIKVFIGYLQEQRPGFGGSRVVQSPSDYPYPVPLPMEMLGKEGKGSLSDQVASTISYYEPDGKGNLRVCRVEDWLPPHFGDNEAHRQALRRNTQQYVASHPILSKLDARYMVAYAKLYFYDRKGRIVGIEHGDFQKPDEPAVVKICRSYDDKDRTVLILNPHTSQHCSASPPDVRDEWLRYRYGEYNGEQVRLLDEWHHGNAQGTWSKQFTKFATGPGPQDISGGANAKSGKGVTIIYGSNAGKLDDNAANTVVDAFGHWNGSTYFFTKLPVPLEVLEKPDLIYQHERRRQTYIEGDLIKLFELFEPNQHFSRHRYYFLRDMLRNEQLDAQGRVTRVITVGDYRQPRLGPHPDVDDRLLTDNGLRLIGHQIFHRVYDFDAKGHPKLVAVSWNRTLRLNPLKKMQMDLADVVYGTPGGAIRWKNMADFEKQFGFSSKAAEVFPDEADGKESED